MGAEWLYYAGPGGRQTVDKEITDAKLPLAELARLQALMERYKQGHARRNDWKYLRDGVYELRLRGDSRIFRLYFAHEGGDGSQLMLLALHFAGKKKQNDRAAVTLAVDRLREWRRRQ